MKPIVDAAGFAKIECNRCGNCCESMVLDFDPADRLNWLKADPDRCIGDPHDHLTHEESVAQGEMILEMLESTGEVNDRGEKKYKCLNFSRDVEGKGLCGVYASRPGLCSRFPYGAPSSFPGCSWDVRVVAKLLPVVRAA